MQTKYFLIITALLPTIAFANPPQDSQCIGTSGPVQAIYLHGWFEPRGKTSYVNLESDNRGRLAQLAARMHIRIAVPVSTFIAPSSADANVRFWDRSQFDIKYIESAARAACKGAGDLAPDRYLIGFSNGGNKAWRLSGSGCSTMGNYKKILVLGPAIRTSTAPACRAKTKVVIKHEVPAANVLQQYLEN